MGTKDRFQEVSTYLRQKRIEAGLTQKEVSDQFGLTTTQFVSNWERGLCLPPANYLPVLCRLFKISKEDLIERLLRQREAELLGAFRQKSAKSQLKNVAKQ